MCSACMTPDNTCAVPWDAESSQHHRPYLCFALSRWQRQQRRRRRPLSECGKAQPPLQAMGGLDFGGWAVLWRPALHAGWQVGLNMVLALMDGSSVPYLVNAV